MLKYHSFSPLPAQKCAELDTSKMGSYQIERTPSLDLANDNTDYSSVHSSEEDHVHLISGKQLQKAVWNTEYNWRSPFPHWEHYASKQSYKHRSRSCPCPRRSILRTFRLLSYYFCAFILIVLIVTYAYFPSYTILPEHYKTLKERARDLTHPGRGNVNQEKVFIAASLFDPKGRLAGGPWADNVLQLIELLGPANTFLSVYENDSGPDAQLALSRLDAIVPCNHSLVFEEHLGFDSLPAMALPDGTTRVKRIAYLAEVRNKALEPLDTMTEMFDKVLYLNDVFFDPVEALQLLFSTNVNSQDQTEYRAACAVDFINPFKFYDTFATRDLGGWSMGVPFFPWFAYGGDPRSHSDVVRGKDAVRVRSCWGGMIAFDATFFQPRHAKKLNLLTAAQESPGNSAAPYRFRAEDDLFWHASECCLIHADIQSPDPDNTGIFMNPFVRCAYDQTTLSWLRFTRRFERLYTPLHFLIDILASMPRSNPRRDEKPWEQVEVSVWVANDTSASGGSFETRRRIATHSGFCGKRGLSVMKERFVAGERNYDNVRVPSS